MSSGLATQMILLGTEKGRRRKDRQKNRLEDIINPTALRKAKNVYYFGLSECNGVKRWTGMDFASTNSCCCCVIVLSPQ